MSQKYYDPWTGLTYGADPPASTLLTLDDLRKALRAIPPRYPYPLRLEVHPHLWHALRKDPCIEAHLAGLPGSHPASLPVFDKLMGLPIEVRFVNMPDASCLTHMSDGSCVMHYSNGRTITCLGEANDDPILTPESVPPFPRRRYLPSILFPPAPDA